MNTKTLCFMLIGWLIGAVLAVGVSVLFISTGTGAAILGFILGYAGSMLGLHAHDEYFDK